jgi:hypothetical protein
MLTLATLLDPLNSLANPAGFAIAYSVWFVAGSVTTHTVLATALVAAASQPASVAVVNNTPPTSGLPS